ncbi:hypothetical protein E2C01_060954 [Portunus trituberculatus]|uniref:Uncharacterized protein n=1 Tax=Portunus trituberculatus TaxID=210409 RepID=A0A5B7H6U8_PORTR|nr:hypothetical protein [Portunus trituberculatus]
MNLSQSEAHMWPSPRCDWPSLGGSLRDSRAPSQVLAAAVTRPEQGRRVIWGELSLRVWKEGVRDS